MNTGLLNPRRHRTTVGGLFTPEEYADVRRYFGEEARIPVTPLRRLDGLARSLGLAGLLVKDENGRSGLPAFKITGVAYAVRRLRAAGALDGASTLACATAGNHGRAVARAAREAGIGAAVYVPKDTSRLRMEAIRSEGARLVVFDGTYEEAVRQLAADAPREGWTVVSDTSWPAYEQIPRWIMAGYTQVIDEASHAWPVRPDVVLVQAGVGGLACAVASWLAAHHGQERPFLIVCEPAGAACVLASARAGRAARLEGPADTVMAGLRCTEPSPLALVPIMEIADAFVAIDDRWSLEAMRRLARPAAGNSPVASGPSGACGVGTLLALLQDPALREVRDAAGLGPDSRAFVINTEGPVP